MKPPKDNKPTGRAGSRTTRRGFLKRTLAVAAAATVADSTALFSADGPDQPAGPSAAGVGNMPRVVRVVSEKIVPVRVVQQALLKDAIAQGLSRLTNESNASDAWHRILKPDDVILIKFNRSGANCLGTTAPMATELLNSLMSAGWGPDRIMLLEVGDNVHLARRTRPADLRWQGRVIDFGSSGKDVFIAALEEATAVINVPFLKTHHRATLTSCLKNLSHGLIRHPARFHANGCDPAIGEIVASDPIRRKLRLNVVNALRVLYRRSPEVREEDVVSAGIVLFGTDPVACDAVGFGVLNGLRSTHNLLPLLPLARAPRQLATAARLGVGEFDIERIDVQNFEM